MVGVRSWGCVKTRLGSVKHVLEQYNVHLGVCDVHSWGVNYYLGACEVLSWGM